MLSHLCCVWERWMVETGQGSLQWKGSIRAERAWGVDHKRISRSGEYWILKYFNYNSVLDLGVFKSVLWILFSMLKMCFWNSVLEDMPLPLHQRSLSDSFQLRWSPVPLHVVVQLLGHAVGEIQSFGKLHMGGSALGGGTCTLCCWMSTISLVWAAETISW